MIHYDMPEAKYRALPGYGSTDLKNALRSYQHMVAARLSFHETPALKFGRAFHCAVLEPERWKSDYTVMPDFSGKGSREKKEHWILEHADHEWITAEDYDTVRAMERALRNHNAAFNLLLDAKMRELSLEWGHFGPSSMLSPTPCKARLDAVTPWGILDLKTTTDASPEGFGKQVANLNYLLQAAHYSEGANNNGLAHHHFTFMAVEKEPPYGVGVYEIDSDQLGLGRALRDRALENMRIGQDKKTPYASNTQPLQLPPWAYKGNE